MDIVSNVVTEKKDSATLPQTRIVRTYGRDAAQLEGKPVPPITQPLPSVPEAVSAPATPPQDEVVREAKQAPSITQEVPVVSEKKQPEMMVFPAKRPLTPTPEVEPLAQEKRMGTPSPLHTYQIDFAEHVKKTNASPLSVLAAERDAKRPELPLQALRPSHTGRLLLLRALLLVLGAGGSYATYRYLAPEAVTMFSQQVTSLVFADEQQELSGSGKTLQNAVVASVADPLSLDAIRILYIATSTPEAVTRQPASGKEFIEALDVSAPDILIRNSYPESTFGVIHAGEGTYPFFILKVSSFESTFRGMLDWENTIAEDLALFYPPYPKEPVSVSATTTEPIATTTEVVIEEPPVAPLHFVDQTVANNDVRVLLDAKGRSILLYGYRDKTTLIIARDVSAFTEIVQRLAATRQQ